jgi:ribulose-5-phosphate 4-epimerase/fuculose-1-phosphate aldolase
MGLQDVLKNERIIAGRRVAGGTISEDETKIRIDLAAAYRLAARNGWTDLIYTHMSARVPGSDEHFLINPFGLAFDEVTASNLVKIDHTANVVGDSPHPVNAAGFVIHHAVHAARPELKCVMHLHTEAGIALSMLKGGLLPLSQHAMMFYNRIGYHGYEGFALNLSEQELLVADLGNHRALILHNHDLLTAGESVAEAYVRMYYLERAARTQMIAMAASSDLIFPPKEVAEATAREHNNLPWPLGEREWPALLRGLDREDRSYRE